MSTIYNLGYSRTRRIITTLAACGTLGAALVAPHVTSSAHVATHPVDTLASSTLPTPTSHKAASPHHDRAAAIIAFTNVKRAQHGLPPVTENTTLSQTVAQPWAEHMMAEDNLHHRPEH